MEVVCCDNCRVKTAPSAAVHGLDGKVYCAQCAPLFKPAMDASKAAPSKFYFCETCGKRVSDADIERGGARDKKVKGYFCKDCAVGVMTIEFEAIKDVPVATHAPNPGSRTGLTPVHRAAASVDSKQKSRGQPQPANPATADGERRAIPTTAIVGGVAIAVVAFAITVGLFGGASKKAGTSVQASAPNKPAEASPLPASAPGESTREPSEIARMASPVLAPVPVVPIRAGEAPRVRAQTAESQKVPAPETQAKPPKTVTKQDPSAPFEPGASITCDFEGELDTSWHVEGATLSDEQAHEGKKSLKVGEKQAATLRFGAGADLPVKIRFWVYDSGKKFGARAVDGPKWGITDGAGNTFCIRLVWRAFLAGDNEYAWTNTGENKWFSVWQTHVHRKEGWTEWVFDFTNSAAPAITGGKSPVTPVTAKFMPKGAVAISLFGGAAETGPLYIDDISVEYPKK